MCRVCPYVVPVRWSFWVSRGFLCPRRAVGRNAVFFALFIIILPTQPAKLRSASSEMAIFDSREGEIEERFERNGPFARERGRN